MDEQSTARIDRDKVKAQGSALSKRELLYWFDDLIDALDDDQLRETVERNTTLQDVLAEKRSTAPSTTHTTHHARPLDALSIKHP